MVAGKVQTGMPVGTPDYIAPEVLQVCNGEICSYTTNKCGVTWFTPRVTLKYYISNTSVMYSFRCYCCILKTLESCKLGMSWIFCCRIQCGTTCTTCVKTNKRNSAFVHSADRCKVFPIVTHILIHTIVTRAHRNTCT